MQIFVPDSTVQVAALSWEELIPILFFVIYGIVQLIASQRNKSGGEEAGEDPADLEAEERARKIREEIQRKLQNRGNKPSRPAEPESPEPATASAPSRRREYDPRLPDDEQPQPWDWESPKKMAPPDWEESHEPSHWEERPREQRSGHPSGMEDIEQQLANQRQKVKESLRERDAAKVKAEDIRKKAGIGDEIGSPAKPKARSAYDFRQTRESLRGDLIEALKNPKTTRQAMVLSEILGDPKSLQGRNYLPQKSQNIFK